MTESGSGGAYSGGSAQYFYLPTASGPMPVAAVIAGNLHAVHSDHLNTPRRLTNASGQVVWQWAYSAFGEDAPTTAATRFTSPTTTPTTGSTSFSEVKFNLRYPGQYADAESGLNYNYFRSYNPATGRYTQADPIGLNGGWNRFGYVDANPLSYIDPYGLQALPFPMPFPGLGGMSGTTGAGGGYDPRTDSYRPSSPSLADRLSDWIFAKPPENAYDPNGPKAQGKPTEADGFKSPKGGDNWVPNPNPGKGGSSYGWQDSKGDVWCPTGPAGPGSRAHGGPHWDVQSPGGGYRNIRPQQGE